MTTVGAFDAKTHLPALLERVSRGERITITKHGVPIAMLIPAGQSERRQPKEIVDEIRQLRKGTRLGKLTVRELIERGRRF